MKFGCMSCGAKYSVPDGRLGAAGVRVRCTRCRAIMVVAPGQPNVMPRGDDEDTRKELRYRKRPATTSSDGPALPALISAEPSASDDGLPAALSASGVFRPLPGVNRQVTGLFFAEVEDARASAGRSGRVWYAAIDERPRGPFSATEMISLAERGKVRDATLVWRPGFSTWKKVKNGEAGTVEDLTWLRKIVVARKLREMDAQERAQQRLGIQPVQLVRTSSGKKKGTWQGGAPGLPPPLPQDSIYDDTIGDVDVDDASLDADARAGADVTAEDAEKPLPIDTLLDGPSGWRARSPWNLSKDAGAPGAGSRPGTGPHRAPSGWAHGTRRSRSRAPFVAAAVAAAGAAVVVAVVIAESSALDRLLALLSP